MRRRLPHALIAIGVLIVLLALTACSTPSGSSSSGNTITMQNIAFNPTSLTVKAGDTVTFRNSDSVEHHIVVGTKDLGVQQPGQDKTWKAPKDGVYMMKCLIHPQMQGQITVGAGGPTVGSPSSGGGMGNSTGGNSTGGGTPGY
jgi:plastocyanin